MWINVPGRYAVRVSGDWQVTISGRVDSVCRVLWVVVDGLVAGPCRVVNAQDRSEHSSAGRVVVRDFRRSHVVRSCIRTAQHIVKTPLHHSGRMVLEKCKNEKRAKM